MRAAGIICEYNPFHNGHQYHMQKTREITGAEYIICVMSGHFTQRGDAAVADKWTRAKWALDHGASLVIELPAVYALQSAERFAQGSINILNGLGVCTHLSFGSEFPDIELIGTIATLINEQPGYYKYILKKNIDEGLSFPKARQAAVMEFFKNSESLPEIENILQSPNCILAIEYLRALIKTDSDIEPVSIAREGEGYNSLKLPDSGFVSARAIRAALNGGSVDSIVSMLPGNVMPDLIGNKPINEMLSQIIMYELRKQPVEYIEALHDVTEGLENRIKKSAMKFASYHACLADVKSKRFTMTRLQRICIYAIMNITSSFMEELDDLLLPCYARILGMKKSAQPLLTAIKNSSTIPVISKAASYKQLLNAPQKNLFMHDVLATDIYSLFIGMPAMRDFTQEIIVMD